MSDEKSCFVISPIGEPDSEDRKRSDQVLNHIISPAVAACGYKAIRADDLDKPGIITSQIIQRVVADELVIADLTSHNPNVFYELAVRHVLRKPHIQLMESGGQIPFDVAANRTVFVDHHDLDSVEAAKTKIQGQVAEIEADPTAIETPISVSLDLQLLRQSERPEDRSLADLVGAISDLRSEVASIDIKIDGLQGASPLEALTRQFDQLRSSLISASAANDSIDQGAMREMWLMFDGAGEQAPRIKGLEFLVLASCLRPTAPWVSELAMETYRSIRNGRGHIALMSALSRAVHYLNDSRRGHHNRSDLAFCRHLLDLAQSTYR